MEKISWTIKKIPEYKILLSCLSVLIISFLSVCVYGFLIGGSYLDGKYLCFVIWTSLIFSFLLSLFMFGKSFLKKFFNKEYRERHIWGIVCLLFIIIQFFFYSSANKTFADADNIKEVEVEIVCINEHVYGRAAAAPSSADIYFIDSTGTLNSVWYDYFYEDDEPLPTVGGTIIINETVGAFGYSVCEFIEVTS